MKQYRLITRADLDGIVSAVLLKKLDLINEIKFAHPKDMQDGKVEVFDSDIITNLPYHENAHFVFDHHYSEDVRAYNKKGNHIINPAASSAARVIYEYFGGVDKFPHDWVEILDAVDMADSGQFTEASILNPKGWALLNYLIDPRTGLGRFNNFRLSNFEFILELIDFIQEHPSIDKILKNPDVVERVGLYFDEMEEFKKQIRKIAKIQDNALIIDLRNEDIIHAGNRFMIYAMYPECNISIHCLWGFKKQNISYAVGKSVINRTSNTNIGELMAHYGGGGHRNAGTCQIELDKADKVLEEILKKINEDG